MSTLKEMITTLSNFTSEEKNRLIEKLPDREIGKSHLIEIIQKLGRKSKSSE